MWLVCVHGYTDVYVKFMFFYTQKQKRPTPPSTQQMLQVLSPKQENTEAIRLNLKGKTPPFLSTRTGVMRGGGSKVPESLLLPSSVSMTCFPKVRRGRVLWHRG